MPYLVFPVEILAAVEEMISSVAAWLGRINSARSQDVTGTADLGYSGEQRDREQREREHLRKNLSANKPRSCMCAC
jgi:hypothetical protein